LANVRFRPKAVIRRLIIESLYPRITEANHMISAFKAYRKLVDEHADFPDYSADDKS